MCMYNVLHAGYYRDILYNIISHFAFYLQLIALAEHLLFWQVNFVVLRMKSCGVRASYSLTEKLLQM